MTSALAPWRRRIWFLLIFGGMAVSPARATMLSVSMTVDNSFTAYLGTSDSVAGAMLGSGNGWTATYSFSGNLTDGATNYLHIFARDVGVIAGFMGQFSLSDAAFGFANGTQYLLTDTDHWTVSMTGFGAGYQTPAMQGANGSGPWGARGDIDPAADWIWRPDNCTNCYAYFSTPITPITPVAQADVPEPAAPALLGVGLAGLGFARRRAVNP